MKNIDAMAKEFFDKTLQQLSALEDRKIVLPKNVVLEMKQDMAVKLSELMVDYANEILQMEVK